MFSDEVNPSSCNLYSAHYRYALLFICAGNKVWLRYHPLDPIAPYFSCRRSPILDCPCTGKNHILAAAVMISLGCMKPQRQRYHFYSNLPDPDVCGPWGREITTAVISLSWGFHISPEGEITIVAISFSQRFHTPLDLGDYSYALLLLGPSWIPRLGDTLCGCSVCSWETLGPGRCGMFPPCSVPM